MNKKIVVKKSILILMFLTYLDSVIAYPVIVSDYGTNHTENKKIVFSVPERYYANIDMVYFTKDFLKYRFLDGFGQLKVWGGWNRIIWDDSHNCHDGKIIIYAGNLSNKVRTFKTLQHELGHIYELCGLKRNTTTEEFADGFGVKGQGEKNENI